jgi:hypothetical protein
LELLVPRARGANRPGAALLAEVSREPLARGTLADLGADHRGWISLGAQLAAASRTPGEAGERGLLALLRGLPAELQQSLGVTD